MAKKIIKNLKKKFKKFDSKVFFSSIIFLTISFFLFFEVFDVSINTNPRYSLSEKRAERQVAFLQEQVMPKEGVVLPVRWKGFGKQLIDIGIIDADKFEAIYKNRSGLGEYERQLLYGDNIEALIINEENSGVILNLLWAFGLANQNRILEEGPMQDEQYGGADRFASTGGWTLGVGNAMDYYSSEKLVILNEEQQRLVERVSKNIYRPCCGNSTYFPDCNHGMAMLGFLEIMASQGVLEQEMYDAALSLNSFWFPQTYLTIATYFQDRDVDWDEVNAKTVLGSSYSSGSGYRDILTEVDPPTATSGGGSCGV